jgi:hypothetical protein
MTSPQGTLAAILSQTAELMLAEYEQTRSIEHRGSKGTVRESLVLDRFLSKYMPRNVDVVGSGEACAVDGTTSSQCDLMVVDPQAPFLLEKDDYRIAAIEAVFGVIEVKSNLTADELAKSCRKIADLKAMPKTAFRQPMGFQQTRNVYGKKWPYMPVVGMVFGYEGAELRTLGDAMMEVVNEYPDEPHLWVDSVWVLKKGSLTWADGENQLINMSPKPGDTLRALESTPGQVLLQLAVHLFDQYATAWSDGLRLWEYVKKEAFGVVLGNWAPDEVILDGGTV